MTIHADTDQGTFRGEQRPSAKRPDGMPYGRPFRPGQSGNPAGRPKEKINLTGEVRKLLEERPDLVQAVAETLIESAIEGKAPFMNMLLDRIDGQLSNIIVEADVVKSIIMVPPDGAEPPRLRGADDMRDVEVEE